MQPKSTPRTPRRLGVLVAIAGTLLFVTAAPALADTSEASARSVHLSLFGQTVVDTGTVEAANDGTTETTTGPTSPALSLLSGQTVLQAGLLPQNAVAGTDGSSAACAGVLGAGGLIQIGDGGNCAITQGDPGGLVVDLAPLVTLSADAVTAQCTAHSDGSTSVTVTIVNGKVTTGSPPAQSTVLTLPLHADVPNTGLDVPGIATILLNEQPASQPAGSVTTTALHVHVLDAAAGGLDLSIGTITCGPNGTTGEIPAIVAKGLPLTALVVAVLGTPVVLGRRRRGRVEPAV